MRRAFGLVGCLSLSLLLAGCGAGKEADAAQEAAGGTTPQDRFEALVAAIRGRDIEAYRRCWSPRAKPGESMIEKLEADPLGGHGKLWNEMLGVFKGPLTLIERGRTEVDGVQLFKGKVEAPEADGGGVGTLMMIRDADGWRMYSW